MKIRVPPERIGKIVAALIRAIGRTMRFQIEDRARVTDPTFKQAMIWTFWHNRMFVIPLLLRWHVRHRDGTAMTSASKDGEMVAAVLGAFRIKTVRGSSSRRGATAVRELAAVLESGEDGGISPDGPRGPRYSMSAGPVYLAQQTGVAILPIHVEYSRAWRLKTWDAFMIPMPFSAVRVIFGELIFVPQQADVETERAKLEAVMQPETK